MIENVQLLIGCSWHMYMKKQAFGQRSYCEKVETGLLMIESQARLPLAPSPSTNRPVLTDEYHISMLTPVSSGYPNPTRYPVFRSIPDPT